MKIVAFTACNSTHLDLTDFGSGNPKNAGVNKMSKFITDNHFKLIYQSPTGFYRREVDLNNFGGEGK